MNKYLTTAVAAATLSLHSVAAPAVPGTLADYLALGPGGATIGTTLFSDFSLLPLQMGAIEISPLSIQVIPLDLPGNPALQFVLNQPALSGELFELKLGYNVADLSIIGASVSIAGAVTTDDGAVTSILDGIPGNPPLIAFSTFGIDEPLAQGNFASVSVLAVQLDTVVDGGLAGTAGLISTTNQFVASGAPIPEPSSILFGTALLGVCLGVRSRRTHAA